MSRHQKAFENSQHARFMRPDAGRWLRPDIARFLDPALVYPALGPAGMKYSSNQPRVPAGQTGGGAVDRRGRWQRDQ